MKICVIPRRISETGSSLIQRVVFCTRGGALAFLLVVAHASADQIPRHTKPVLSNTAPWSRVVGIEWPKAVGIELPKVLWKELWATAEGLAELGRVRRFEWYYREGQGEFVSEGLRYPGAPFTQLLIDPNALPARQWDYRVKASQQHFTAIARRKDGPYKGREIWLNEQGHWAGDYPFWPLRFPWPWKKRSILKIHAIP